jgi:NADPH:quinone reductase-like Zn-dependent oxidoreductase
MKAFQLKRYGNPEDVLTLLETQKPLPRGCEVLIKVKATTVNDYDWCLTTGTPYSCRLFFGLLRPRKKLQRPGMEVAGIVVETGPDCRQFKPGDRVYGDTSNHSFGAHAEYQCVSEAALRKTATSRNGGGRDRRGNRSGLQAI